jgi:hypothetical protein
MCTHTFWRKSIIRSNLGLEWRNTAKLLYLKITVDPLMCMHNTFMWKWSVLIRVLIRVCSMFSVLLWVADMHISILLVLYLLWSTTVFSCLVILISDCYFLIFWLWNKIKSAISSLKNMWANLITEKVVKLLWILNYAFKIEIVDYYMVHCGLYLIMFVEIV